jgi:hypothetical protein
VRGSGIEERLRRLEDLEAIRELFLDYGRTLDHRRFEECSRLFAERGQFVAPFDTFTGPDGILALLHAMLGDHLSPDAGRDFHVFANPAVELEGDRATAHSFWIYVTPDAAGHPRVAQLGHYEDTVIRAADGRWRFEQRVAKRDLGIAGGGVPASA